MAVSKVWPRQHTCRTAPTGSDSKRSTTGLFLSFQRGRPSASSQELPQPSAPVANAADNTNLTSISSTFPCSNNSQSATPSPLSYCCKGHNLSPLGGRRLTSPSNAPSAAVTILDPATAQQAAGSHDRSDFQQHKLFDLEQVRQHQAQLEKLQALQRQQRQLELQALMMNRHQENFQQQLKLMAQFM